MSETTNDDLLDTPEAARVLGNAAGTLEVWRSTKRHNLPYVKIGRSVKYRRVDLLKFIADHTVKA